MKTRSKDLYDNCQIIDPNGKVICRCSQKRISWYVERDLAKIVCSDPVTAQLVFTPKGRGHEGDEFYLTEKLNQCVVCGVAQDLVRFRIVPRTYRQHLPESLKSRSSHDLILLCLLCKLKADVCLGNLQRNLSEQYHVPIHGVSCSDERFKSLLRKHISAISLLNKTSIPDQRKSELLSHIREFVEEHSLMFSKSFENSSTFFETFIREGKVLLDAPMEKVGQGELIMNDIKSSQDPLQAYTDFIQLCRRHFIDFMEPKHLPDHWSVSHSDRNR